MELSKKTKEYWKEKDWQDLEKSQNIKDLYTIAERVISRMPKPMVSVCGPIATGGFGSIDKNLELFNNEIIKLQKNLINVFDQMPFEDMMQKLKITMGLDQCCKSIVDDFYLPIFNSGYISDFYFIKNWESSNGAKWEHEIAKKLGIKINYLN